MDDELQRLERALAEYPFDRALPDLDKVLQDASVSVDLLADDDRARKLLHEALIARPHSDLDQVRRLSTEVELLVLEVRSLSALFADERVAADELTRATAKLDRVRARLVELTASL